MSNTNYTLNIDNILEYFKYASVDAQYIHECMGLNDERAMEVSNRAYNIVWDEIESEDGFRSMDVINTLFKAAKEENYNDVELAYYLYFGFSEIDSYLNPTIELIPDEGDPSKKDVFLN